MTAWLRLLVCAVAAWPRAAGQLQHGRTVHLGYAAYTSVFNATTGLHVWKGIRYAQPPVGKLRWQEPRPPLTGNGSGNAPAPPILADHFGPACPQSLPQLPGASALLLPGDEDCLFVNVYAPPFGHNASSPAKRPVLVWIHGGGYGQGDGTQDLSAFLAATNRSIVGVSLQYRLGAFGFLAGGTVRRRGRLNAGLRDQRAALQWVQRHIARFGGDPGRVTVAGESAGAGSILLHATAADANNGQLFRNIFAASPWIPTQPVFDEAIAERHYADFVAAAGCNGTLPGPNASASAFDCLVTRDSLTLQRASNWVSTNPPTPYSNWAFIPVTDGTYVTGPPSVRLATGPVHGRHALIGNNADEGVLLVPATLRTEADLVAWLHAYFHNLEDADVAAVRAAYPVGNDTATNNSAAAAGFETDGVHEPTANDVSSAATGVQQRAYNIYAEASVVCPSYWLATAFAHPPRSTTNKTTTASYHYQYSVPFAAHGADLSAYWGPPGPNQGPDLVQAFREIIARFVLHDNPSLPAPIANGRSLPAADQQAANPATAWPLWQQQQQQQSGGGGCGADLGCSNWTHTLLVLNQTGGTSFAAPAPNGRGTVPEAGPPGQHNRITLADADAWEGGRGARCAFWQQLGPKIPQ
ncbi:inactive carboxylesterase 4 [Niveomyces insectorum RCEF 264]|uniref:Carboxylic ester hydrolase n=1 Tax=Niveomyces insectorum RCEF 264 TaxID=1081102 RepID=A0A167SNK4_9HYPO|nr:inactive carboxylesterase 4 [Niveomyces insectorum RCEF 264]